MAENESPTAEKWHIIRQEYEKGASLRSLATKHDVPKTSLIRKRDAEGWTRTGGPVLVHGPVDQEPPQGVQPPADALTIARLGLRQLAQHLQGKDTLSIANHKLLSDALATYVKVLLMVPREVDTQDGLVLPLEKLLPETRTAIRRLLAEDEDQQARMS
jgi:transposase-like protein